MKGTKRVILPVIMALALLIGMQSTSHAATSMELSLWDLVNAPIVVLDNGTGDFDPTVGSVTFIGPIGNWNVNVTTGVTYPALGTTDTPKMDLNSVNVSFHFYTISEFIIHGHATMERTRSVSHSIARSDASRWFSSASMLSNTRLWNDFSLRSSHTCSMGLSSGA